MGVDAQMLVRVPRRVDDMDVLELAKGLFHRFGDVLGLWGEDNEHCAKRVHVYEQDGPDIHPRPDETLIEVQLSCRYYGKGYERGPWHQISSVRRYILAAMPGCEVWYGGDSSGVCAEVIDDAADAEMWGHFNKHGHHPYRNHFDSGWNDGIRPPDPCPRCLAPLIRNGYGPRFAAAYCDTCTLSVETRDGGKTYAKRKEY